MKKNRPLRKNKSGSYSTKIEDASGSEAHISLGTKNRREAAVRSKAQIIDEIEKMGWKTQLDAGEIAFIARNLINKARHSRLADTVTFDHAIELWIDAMRRARAGTTIRNHEFTIRDFARTHGLEGKSPHEVTPDMIDAFVNPDDATKKTTRSKRLYSLRVFFDFCLDPARGWVSSNPAKQDYGVRVKSSKMTQEQRAVKSPKIWGDRAWSQFLGKVEHEIANLESDLIGCKPGTPKDDKVRLKLGRLHFWRVATTISRESGLRLSDIASLEWSTIGATEIRLEMRKVERTVRVEITPDMRKSLAATPRTSDTYCFPEQHEMVSDPRRRTTLSKDFEYMMERFGMREYTFHGLRHTYAMRNIHAYNLPEKLGHSSPRTTDTYTKHDPRDVE